MHHSFDISLAKKYGIEEAILIHHFQHWIGINQRLKRNFHEGRTWTYQTLDEIAAHFPYLSRSQVFDLLEKLCTGKGRKSKKNELDFEPILVKGNFNKSTYDRTVWYAFSQEPEVILGNPNDQIGKSQNQYREIPTPIPDTIPYSKTDKLYCVATPPWEKIEKVDCEGKKFSISRHDIVEECVKRKLDWTTLEIEKLWDLLVRYSLPIRSWFALCEGTVKNMRTMQAIKKLNAGDKKCQSTKNQSENIKKNISENVILERPFAKCKFRNGCPIKLLPT